MYSRRSSFANRRQSGRLPSYQCSRVMSQTAKGLGDFPALTGKDIGDDVFVLGVELYLELNLSSKIGR